MASIKPLINFKSDKDLKLDNNFPSIYLYKFSLNFKTVYGIVCDVKYQSPQSKVIEKAGNVEIPFDFACYFKDYRAELLYIFKNIVQYSKPRFEDEFKEIYILNDQHLISALSILFSPEKLYMTKGYENYSPTTTQMFLYITD